VAQFDSNWVRSFNRRRVLGGVAVGAALPLICGRPTLAAGRRAQEGTPEAAACGEPIDTARLDAIPKLAEGTKPVIAIVPKGVHPFFEDCRIGAEEEATKLGVDFQWVAPQAFDAAVQVKLIEDLIARQVNAIVISPNEPTSVEPVIADAMSKGILALTFDSDSPASERVMYIGTNNKTAGVVQGETLSGLLGGTGKVAIITGGLGALNLNERIEGLKSALPPEIEIVDTVATDEDLQKGLGVSEALLRAHPDLNGIACMSATGGPTLAQVITAPEFEGRDIKIVAFDDLEEVLRAIEDGIIAATMVQRPVQMGVLSIEWANNILTGAATPECALLDTGVTVVTLENIDSYTK
jgi:ribose transport system substrate-binding protein